MNTLKDLFYFTYKEKRALIVLLIIGWAIGGSFIIFDSEGTTIKANDTSPLISTQKPNKYLLTQKKNSTDRSNYQYQPKYKKGIRIDLNKADSSELKMIPGIGSSTAKRILQYKDKLGGYYSTEQLYEIRSLDSINIAKFQAWLHTPKYEIKRIRLNSIQPDSMLKHPYLSFKQVKAIQYLLKYRKRITNWTELMMLEEFTENDKQRLIHYLSFE